MLRGRFIVIDGTDGSGKKTQVDLLAARVREEGRTVHVADFPQYGKPSAYFVERYLNGAYGTLDTIDGYRGSLFFAMDRYDASFELRKMMDTGAIIVSNRYVSANMGHQGAMIADTAERKKYLDWLYHLEFEILGIPKPDLTIILHVSALVGQELVDHKGHREYVGGRKRDLLESDLDHLKAAEQTYLEIARFPKFKLIECMKSGSIMTREDIHELIWREVVAVL
ncbi:MAG: hypothetical protein AAB490_01040 [Patescibacteria group bacterium]